MNNKTLFIYLDFREKKRKNTKIYNSPFLLLLKKIQYAASRTFTRKKIILMSTLGFKLKFFVISYQSKKEKIH